MKQTNNGKAFEYALSMAFHNITHSPIFENSALNITKKCYYELNVDYQNILDKASKEIALFLQAHDKKIVESESIILQPDNVGITGDVRDIIIKCPNGEIGISAKHNHSAVKHSRLSDKIDFGKEWTGFPCSKKYFNDVSSVFAELREMKKKGFLFKDINRKEQTIYLPVLIAFEDELKRLCENYRELFVERLFRYLLGKYDFYKVILRSKAKHKFVSIQSVNIGGTLGYGSKWKIPDIPFIFQAATLLAALARLIT